MSEQDSGPAFSVGDRELEESRLGREAGSGGTRVRQAQARAACTCGAGHGEAVRKFGWKESGEIGRRASRDVFVGGPS